VTDVAGAVARSAKKMRLGEPLVTTDGPRRIGRFDNHEEVTLGRLLERLVVVQSRTKASNVAMGLVMCVVRWLLPSHATLVSYRRMASLVDRVMLRNEQLVAICPMHCVAYYNSPLPDRNQYAKHVVCPVCCASRWAHHPGAGSKQFPVPHQFLLYIPLRDSLQTVFSSPSVAREMRLDVGRPAAPPRETVWFDIHHSQGWADCIASDRRVQQESRTAILLEENDSFPTFDKGNPHNTHPTNTIILNLSAPTRVRLANVITRAIFAGTPRTPTDPIQHYYILCRHICYMSTYVVYVDIKLIYVVIAGQGKCLNYQLVLNMVVDDDISMHQQGARIVDASTDEEFTEFALVAGTTADYPGAAETLNILQSGSLCCRSCEMEGHHCECVNRDVYKSADDYTRRTNASYQQRGDLAHLVFPPGLPKKKFLPLARRMALLTGSDLFGGAEGASDSDGDSDSDADGLEEAYGAVVRRVLKGVKGKTAYLRLDAVYSRGFVLADRSFFDLMHIYSNLVKDRLIKMLKGKRGLASSLLLAPRFSKPKPTKVPEGQKLTRAQAEADALRLTEASAAQAAAKQVHLDAIAQQRLIQEFVLSSGELLTAKGTYRTLEGPAGFAHPQQTPCGVNSRFKCADWKNYTETKVMTWHLASAYVTRAGGLSSTPFRVVKAYNDVLALLSVRIVTPELRGTLVPEVKRLVIELELLLPLSEHSKILHALVESAIQIVRWGPAWVRWMFTFER